MTTARQPDAKTLATVTVTFNPDIGLLEKQLRALPRACVKFIVDNASRQELFEQIEALCAHTDNVRLLRNDSNIGLAAALNRGVDTVSALSQSPRFVLLLDQDSAPQPGSIENLIAAFEKLENGDTKVGCVGPVLRDPDTGLTHGFHQCTRWRWKRVYPPDGSAEPVPCANLNGSGTLAPVALFQQLHGLDETLFIDHVDTEWSFRVLAAGYGLWGVPNAVFDHRMGQSSMRFWWFGWRVWPLRSPQRHYYLFRNIAVLMRRPYVPKVWKAWAMLKLSITVVLTVTIGPLRLQQVKRMGNGVWCGLKSRGTTYE